jgi:nucleotide-binding universal stress UspA family protein
MYKKILVPLDGSPLAECVIPHIEAIAKPCGSQVELISVVEPVDIPTRGQIAVSDDDLKKINNEAKKETHKYLDSISERLNRSGIKASPVILMGKPADSLIEYATNNNVDLLIMATHGRSGLTKFFWGSIAEKVLRSICVPVLLVKAGESQAES